MKKLAFLIVLVVFNLAIQSVRADGDFDSGAFSGATGSAPLMGSGERSGLRQDLAANGEADTSLSTFKKTTSREKDLRNISDSSRASAVGHYARARSLLVSAIREFDRANQIGRADAVLDSELWRNTLLQRAEDLDRILAPQPRITEGGVRFEADTRLLQPNNANQGAGAIADSAGEKK